MIYIHTYYTGKFNSVKHVSVHDSHQTAMMHRVVLGGTIKECKVIGEY